MKGCFSLQGIFCPLLLFTPRKTSKAGVTLEAECSRQDKSNGSEGMSTDAPSVPSETYSIKTELIKQPLTDATQDKLKAYDSEDRGGKLWVRQNSRLMSKIDLNSANHQSIVPFNNTSDSTAISFSCKENVPS